MLHNKELVPNFFIEQFFQVLVTRRGVDHSVKVGKNRQNNEISNNFNGSLWGDNDAHVTALNNHNHEELKERHKYGLEGVTKQVAVINGEFHALKPSLNVFNQH